MEDELEHLNKRRNTKTSQSRPADLITTDAQKAAQLAANQSAATTVQALYDLDPTTGQRVSSLTKQADKFKDLQKQIESWHIENTTDDTWKQRTTSMRSGCTVGKLDVPV